MTVLACRSTRGLADPPDGYLEAARVVEQVDRPLTGGLTATERRGTLAGRKSVVDR